MQGLGVPYEGFIPSPAVLMEWGLVVALFVGRWQLAAGTSLAGVVRDLLTASLGVTFPFNLTIGLPLYFEYAKWLHGAGGFS